MVNRMVNNIFFHLKKTHSHSYSFSLSCSQKQGRRRIQSGAGAGAGVDEQRLRVRGWERVWMRALGYAPERFLWMGTHTTINLEVRWARPRPTEADEWAEFGVRTGSCTLAFGPGEFAGRWRGHQRWRNGQKGLEEANKSWAGIMDKLSAPE